MSRLLISFRPAAGRFGAYLPQKAGGVDRNRIGDLPARHEIAASAA